MSDKKVSLIFPLYQNTTEMLSACVVSKILASVLTYPCQNLRACQQAATTAEDAGRATLKRVLAREGLRGLYRGMTPYLMHVVPNVCVVFLIYEAIAGAKK